MNVETISELEDLVIRRLVLEPGEATPWHVGPGLAGWDQPEPRSLGAVNAGPDTYEEVVTFYRQGIRFEVQPETWAWR